MRETTGSVAALLSLAVLATACAQPTPWWKGNLHTHSLWSDGDEYPEMVIDWYQVHGYHFVALSDHNVLQSGNRWVAATNTAGGVAGFERYLARFGDDWVDWNADTDTLEVRLKTLAEFRTLFEQPDQFLIIQSEEITDRFEAKPIHVNATNLAELILPQGGLSVVDVMQRNVDAVLDQRRRTGRPMIPHINHPNFGWAVTAEDLIALRGERFFEVYNGHPAVHNEGDASRPSVERIWDIVLSERLRNGDDVLLGIAVDDSHNYHATGPSYSNPGRAWIMVRAPTLTAEALLGAMESGDFYATTGVELEDIVYTRDRVSISVTPRAGVTYTTQFIGTPRGYAAPVPIGGGGDTASVRFRYSNEIGVVLSEVPGTAPEYVLTGEELYVRAKVISSTPMTNPYRADEVEVAWTQPFFPVQASER